jgi:hypothetical protein
VFKHDTKGAETWENAKEEEGSKKEPILTKN